MTREFAATFVHEDGWWLGSSDDVPGALAQERTLDDARESLREAISDILEVRRELGWSDSPSVVHEHLTVDVA